MVLGMLVIGGSTTVTGAVVGTFVVTIAYEALRTADAMINRSGIASDQVVGLTEFVLAASMIAVLSLRPGGIFPAREIGHYSNRRPRPDSLRSAP